MHQSEMDYRGFTITKTILKNGKVTFTCIIDGSISRATDAARIVAIIDQKLTQEYLRDLFR